MNEPRYINANGLKDTLDYYISEAGWTAAHNEALTWVKDEFIDAEQTADVAPVVHGHWKWVHRLESYECSACGGEVLCDDWGSEQLTDYCPHCSAKMDESEGEQWKRIN